MEVEITTLSKNGQVVIPAEIRKEAHLRPSVKFLVFAADDTICLKRINKDDLADSVDLVRRLERSENDIKKNKVVKADTSMSTEEIDNLLMGD